MFQSTEQIRPKRLPVNVPLQITFESDPVLYTTLSHDGKWLAYVTERGGISALWLRSADPSVVVLPRRVATDPGKILAPAFSQDGRWIAYVGTSYDAKGDIFVMPLDQDGVRPRRLTGRDTEDSSPCFFPDGGTLMFHLNRPPDPQRHLATLDLRAVETVPRVLDTGGDAAFPSVSPDGSKCAFVSDRNDGGGDLFLLDLPHGTVTALTQGPEWDLFPTWSGDAESVYFTRFGSDTNGDGTINTLDNAVVARAPVTGKVETAYPLTSASYSALEPKTGESGLYFLSGRSGISNVWALPTEGEIPLQSEVASQMDLAGELSRAYPPDLHLAVLGYYKVVERFPDQRPYVAKAAYDMGELYLRLHMSSAAENAFRLVVERFPEIQPQAGFSEIHLVSIRTRRQWSASRNEAEQQALLKKGRADLESPAKKHEQQLAIGLRSGIEQGRLLLDLGRKSDSLLDAVHILDRVIRNASDDRSQAAEARVLRADTLSRLGRADAVIPAYMEVVKDYSDVETWADLAVDRILELSTEGVGDSKVETRVALLQRIAHKRLESLPRLAMGAWNRIGDLHFADNEWQAAKEAYRRVLETFPGVTTQTAAARLALAEILYREERFHEALNLYETEIAKRPYEDHIYLLAREGYIRKSVSAGDFLYRIGEVASARTTFRDLIRYDYTIVEAHRGYIKCAAAQKQLPEVLSLYRKQIGQDSADAVALYSAGLCYTYFEGKKELDEARTLIERAIHLQGQIEYFHQTLGYVYEVLETVHDEKGQLEKGLEEYRKAFFLNDAARNPDNHSNLLLNLGNVHFLLGQYGKAFEYYSKRFETGMAFDNEDTEVLFLRRFGAAAFQVGDRKQSIAAYKQALTLIEERIQPRHASELFGRMDRYISESILNPAMGEKELEGKAKDLARRQAALNQKLFEISRKTVDPPPSPAWQSYRKAMESLLSEQASLIPDLLKLVPKNRDEAQQALAYKLSRVRDALVFPSRLTELKAEMLDRLGLAYQEDGNWPPAQEMFEGAYEINQRLGLTRNLATNKRSIAFNAYMEAGAVSGEERNRLLEGASKDFREVIDLARKYGVTSKQQEKPTGAGVGLAFDVALDKIGSTQAMYGFTAEQEERLAEAFIARIQTDLGALQPAEAALEKELQRYPPDTEVQDENAYGVSLLFHRAGLVAYARQDPLRAFDYFRRSAELTLRLGNPVSTVLNVTNMVRCMLAMPAGESQQERRRELLIDLDRKTMQLLSRFPDPADRRTVATYHNTMGVAALSTPVSGDIDKVEAAVRRMTAVERAATHFYLGLETLELDKPSVDRESLALGGAIQINLADTARSNGDVKGMRNHFEFALDLSRRGLLPDIQWRALAGLGRFEEALEALESVTAIRAGCGPMEVADRFAPMVTEMIGSGRTEEAFNLIERLSELDRVQRMAPLVLGDIPRKEQERIRKSYPVLLSLRKLDRDRTKANEAEREYVSIRLGQEKELLSLSIGKNRENLPFPATLATKESDQDRLLILLGLALDAEEEARNAVRDGEAEKNGPHLTKYLDLVRRYGSEVEDAALSRSIEEPAGVVGIFVPEPVEAIDVMESLPADGLCMRFFALSDPKPQWAAFVLTPDEIRVEHPVRRETLKRSESGVEVRAFEEPSRLPFDVQGPLALSGTHLVRSARNRKPFKRKVLEFPGVYALPGPFKVTSLPEDAVESDIFASVSGAHSLLVNTNVYSAISVPTRPGESAQRKPAIELSQGRNLPLDRLFGRLPGISMAVLPKASLEYAYELGQLFSLMGCPTLLLPTRPQEKSAFLEPFFRLYADTSALDAIRAVRSEGATEDWHLVGYWGLSPEAALELGRQQFVGYVDRGVGAFKSGEYLKALSLLENALSVAGETESLKRHLPDLYRYARESAFLADRLDEAASYAKALVDIIAGSQPDSESHAEALLKWGLVLARAERYAEAVPALEDALEIMSNLELRPEQVRALSDLGVVLENATEYDRALVKFQDAASLSKALDKKELLARQYESIGRIYDLRLSQYALARQNYERALGIYKELGSKHGMAQALLDLGRCCRLLGDFVEAERNYSQSLDLAGNDASLLRLKAGVVIEQANNAWYQARYQEAFKLQRQVLDWARQNGWPLEEVLALNTSGLIWWTLGDPQRALRQLEQAMTSAQKLRVRKDEIATILNNKGMVYREMGRFEDALASLDQALAMDRKLKSRWAIAYDLRNTGLTYLRMGQPEKAVPYLEDALAEASSIGNRINEAKILLALGEALSALKRSKEALSAFEKALEASRSMALRETEWRALYGIALIRLDEGRKQEARELLTRAADIVEGMRAEIKLDQLKDGFINNKLVVYEALVTLLCDLGHVEEAFDVGERSRARGLIDLLGNQQLTLRGQLDQQLYQKLTTVRAGIREQEALAAQSADEAERAIYQRTLQQLNDEYRDIMLDIEASNPELASLVSVNPLSSKGVQELLAPDVALLAYYVTAVETFCWIMKADSLDLFRVPVGREFLAASIVNYRRRLQNLEPLETESRGLYANLFSPVISRLKSGQLVGIVPHGPLHYLSFATLQDGEAYLADRYPLFYLPSASVLKYTLERRRGDKNVRVLAIGNPDLHNPALELPFAEREVTSIGWNFPNVTTLTGDRATESWIIEHIGEFGIIHLASHGEFDPINPLFSAVLLARDAQSDGNLEAAEVFGLRINADLVVLSACQTGLGKLTSGDDVIGMNRAFLYAGTHAIISSLWRVSDVSTAMLVKKFYREYSLRSKSESLRRAILHVKNRYPHPGYWGAFVLVGDYF
ncbi:MAG: tetratricopeptide repeat protein [Deltaproteobacteria bacterium]|nr:tetratricopeptide repeat protein [Deltaproteobacteria bacterium]